MAAKSIRHRSGSAGGYLVGRKHTQGGIKAINKSNDQPLEMEGGEVVITAPAVKDPELVEFEGRKMTKREVLSAINVSGGGVSFAKGGDVPGKIHCTGKRYKYGGKTMSDYDIVKGCGCKHEQGGDIDEPHDNTKNKINSGMNDLDIQIARQQQRAEQIKLFALRHAQFVINDYYQQRPQIIKLLATIAGAEKDMKSYLDQLAAIANKHADNADLLAIEIKTLKGKTLNRTPSYLMGEYADASDEKLCADCKKHTQMLTVLTVKEAELCMDVYTSRLFAIAALEKFENTCRELQSIKENILLPMHLTEGEVNITGSNYKDTIQGVEKEIEQAEKRKTELHRRTEVLQNTGIEITDNIPEGTDERVAAFIE